MRRASPIAVTMPVEAGRANAQEMAVAVPTGVCRNKWCSLGASARRVERYPGPGEYCPECGELLEPLSLPERTIKPPLPGRPRLGWRGGVFIAAAGVAIAAIATIPQLRTATHGRDLSAEPRVVSAPAFAAHIVPTPADRAAFESGVERQQRVELVQDPGICSIVLMRATCARVFAQDGPLRSFAQTGNVDQFDWKSASFRAAAVAEGDWKHDPRGAWLRAAGMLYESAVQGQVVDTSSYDGLLKYAGQADGYGALVREHLQGRAPEDADRDGMDRRLVVALQALFPPEATPRLTSANGLRGDMKLGVYAMTAAQMLEYPVLFRQPQSRAFFRDLSLRLAQLQPSTASAERARGIARRFLTVSSMDDWAALRTQWRDDVFYTAVPKTSKRAFVFGIAAVQLAHVAASHRAPTARDEDLAALSTPSDFDSALPGLAEARRATLAARNDWHALNAASTRLVLLIVK